MKLIGLTGYKRSGKDTVASFLEPHGWERAAFADRVKQLALAADPWVSGYQRLSVIVRQLGWDGAKLYPEVRRLLQYIGIEGAREIFGPDCWIQALRRDLLVRIAGGSEGRFVITDVRMENEAEWIRARGGDIWRIVRPGCEADAHATEQGVDRIRADRTVFNDGSLEQLQGRVEALLEGWK